MMALRFRRQKFRWFFRNLGDVEDLTEQLSTSQVQDLSMELGKEDLVFFFQRVHDLLQLEVSKRTNFFSENNFVFIEACRKVANVWGLSLQLCYI